MSSPKQMIVIRKDLNMRKGKMVAQGAHASMAVFFNLMVENGDGFLIPGKKITDAMHEWMTGRFAKICVYVNSEQELLDLYQRAKAAKLPCSLIKDAGLTEFKEPTYTAVAIGPELPEKIDPLTGQLPLL